jgi:hypothetical protein
MRRFSAVALPYSVRLGGPHPSRFGSGRRWALDLAERPPPRWSEEARLFAGTWAAGFLAFSLFLA